MVKYSTQVNGYSAINLTKLDILDSFPEIKVAIAYSLVSVDGKEEKLETFPADLEILEGGNASRRGRLHVEYTTFEGWMTSTTGCQKWKDLPERARSYVEYIEHFIDVPVTHIGKPPYLSTLCERNSANR